MVALRFIKIFILDHHQQISGAKFIFTVEHCSPNALVVDVGPLVTPRYNHGFVHAHIGVTAANALHKFVTRHHHYICKPLETNAGKPYL